MSRASEITEVGEQGLMSGVRPITERDRLEVLASGPLRPRRHPDCQQRPCDLGLFDGEADEQMIRGMICLPNGRAQIDLIDLLQAEGSSEPEP